MRPGIRIATLLTLAVSLAGCAGPRHEPGHGRQGPAAAESVDRQADEAQEELERATE